MRHTVVIGLLALASTAWSAPDQPALRVETGRGKDGFTLAGRDAWQQLLVTAGQRDLTRSVSYESAPPGIVRVDATGLVTPLREGKTDIRVRGAGGASASIAVTVTHLAEDLPVNFDNQVVPVFTKFGCNSGGCHGKASGQNGFKLSLLGFEPGDDYEYLVKEARGRRLFPAAPDYSLLLRKASGAVAHGGGKRLEPDSPFYSVLRRWIEQGAPRGRPDDPTVVRIEVLPRERLLPRGASQQLAVIAHKSDGSTVDVTRMTQFESNQPELADVSATGLVACKELPGSAAVMARYQSHVDVFQATVPLGAPVDHLPPARNFIDELVFARLTKLGIPPSDLADDATLLRRVTVDIAGRLPTLKEVEDYLADRDPAKYEKLVDRLLASPDHGDYFANKWSAVLRNRRKAANDDPKPTFAFHAWIRDNLNRNLPYDQFVRAILTAAGEEVAVPPVIWYREVKDVSAQVEDTAQLFLGQRIACAKCHHHPFEKWSQADYHGFAAFFSQLVIKDPPPPKPAKKPKKGEPEPPPPVKEPFVVSHKQGVARAVNPRDNRSLDPAGLGGKPIRVDADTDPRTHLADWMTDRDNPFFAKALANRYWKHFMGRGLVDPEDDLRLTNPPSHPELLDALARHFARKYDLKDLVRTICTSNVYRLSAVPNRHNADDRQNHSRFVPRRLAAEVLLDSVDDVTLVKTAFKGVPAQTRAVQLPDNQFESYFLSVFGRPDSASACECERKGDASLAQCLHMMNSQEILEKAGGLTRGKANNRAAALAADKRPHQARLRDLYLAALGREPSAEEAEVLLAYLEKNKDKVKDAYEDIVWAVLNTKEFLFNH